MKTITGKRLLSAVLAGLSILLLLFGWIAVKGDYKSYFKESISASVEQFDDILDNYDEYSGYVTMLFGDSVKKGDLRSLRGFLKKVRDGAVSPLEAATMAPTISKAYRMMQGLGMVDASASSGAFWMWVYALIFWLTLAAGVLTVLCHLKGANDLVGKVYAGGLVLIFLVFVLLRSGFEDLGGAMGLTFWPFLCLALGVAAIFGEKLAAKLPAAAGTGFTPVSGAPVAGNAPAAATSDGWVCAQCGAAQKAAAAFCTSCGAPKPQPVVCASCGATLKPGTAFCTSCGAKVEAAGTTATVPLTADETADTMLPVDETAPTADAAAGNAAAADDAGKDPVTLQ